MKEEIISHLLMQKEDATRKDKIEEYIEMAGNSSMYLKDPFDRAIALTFDLVMEEHLDPWDIDLVSFSKLYLKRVKNSGMIDLITAGRIILMCKLARRKRGGRERMGRNT